MTKPTTLSPAQRVHFRLFFDGTFWRCPKTQIRHRKDIWYDLSEKQGFDLTFCESEAAARALDGEGR